MNITTYIKKTSNFSKVVKQQANTSGKAHAEGIIRTFKKMLKSGQFTPKLRPSTLRSKRAQKMPKPETPLYGWGEQAAQSMYNGLRAKKIANGKWVVAPFGKHGKVAMALLFAVHEYGANLKNGGVIRPRRPLKRSVFAYKNSTDYLKENHRLVYQTIQGMFK